MPTQIAGAAGLTVTAGRGFTITVAADVLVHPAASVPVTVYVSVAAGLAVTVVPVPEDNPAVGLQVYEDAPRAVSATELP